MNNMRISLRDALASLETGSRPKGGVVGFSSGVPSLGGEHLTWDGKFNFRKIKYVPAEFAASMRKGTLKIGDILIVKDGATTGKSAVVDESFPFAHAVTNEHLFIVRLKPDYLPKYVGFYLQSREGLGQILSDFRGAAQGGISQNFARLVNIPIKTVKAQREIVVHLEDQLERIDRALDNLMSVLENCKTYRASVLKAACEGRLVPTEAELARQEGRDYETGSQLLTRILETRRKSWNGTGKYKEPRPPEAAADSAVPEGWVVASISQISSGRSHSLGIGPFGSSLKVSDYTGSGVPLVFVRNIRKGEFPGAKPVFVSADKAEELKAHKVFAGDVLVTKMGDPPGDACLYPLEHEPAVITADCIKLTVSSECVPKYIVHAINSDVVKSEILKITKGVAQQKVNLDTFSRLSIPLPPLAEQIRIVAEVERRLSIIDQLEVTESANLQRATRLRQSVLQFAFNPSIRETTK